MVQVVPELLRQALAASGMTGRQLSAATGVTEGRISDYLNGRHDPSATRFLRLIEATGHRVELAGRHDRLERNGLVLAELLDLGEAIAVGSKPRRPPELPPRFRDLVRRGA